MTARRAALAGLLAALLAVAGCTGDGGDASEGSDGGGASAVAEPEPTGVPTIRVTAPPEPEPTGRLYADLRQSSIDASLGRMQVWIHNDTTSELVPTAVRYLDGRLPRPLLGERLRPDPAGSERGYPLVLPQRPDCAAPARAGVVEVVTATGTERVRVDDEADVVARHVAERCSALRLAEVATLSWSDRVAVDRSVSPPVARLVLVVRPRGAEGRELVVDDVAGSHLLQSTSQPPSWAPALRVASDDPVTRVALPLEPARCDVHAFAEGGGATAFRVRYRLDGEPGDLLLRMSPRGASRALDFAREVCGL